MCAQICEVQPRSQISDIRLAGEPISKQDISSKNKIAQQQNIRALTIIGQPNNTV